MQSSSQRGLFPEFGTKQTPPIDRCQTHHHALSSFIIVYFHLIVPAVRWRVF